MWGRFELENHYDWHDDIEFRHHRDKCRKLGVSNTGRNSDGSEIEKLGNTPGVERIRNPGAPKNGQITSQEGIQVN